MAKVADGRRTNGSYTRGLSAIERFWAKVEFTETDCWMWTASTKPVSGYAAFSVEGKTPNGHRWAYLQFRGEVPEGLQLDHLCRNRACVNPWHLEPVTAKVNNNRGQTNAAKSECPSGHPYDEANTAYVASRRVCRICRRAAVRKCEQKKRTAATQLSQAA